MKTSKIMPRTRVAVLLMAALLLAGSVTAEILAGRVGDETPTTPGQQEFGLTKRELVQSVEKVEELIAGCMGEQGFQYVPVDYKTVRRSMKADKMLPGLDEEEFIARYGFGISTLYTGRPPQLATGYSPAKVGLGERNVEIYKGLSPTDQVAYNRALLGASGDATFAVGLESEDFSRCGGCTRAAIENVFTPEQIESSYYNPKDALVAGDPRMRAALRDYAAAMRAAGFDAANPDKVEAEVRQRLDAITAGGTVPVEELSPDQRVALEKLQDYERRLAATNLELEEELIEPVEERVEKELFARRVE